VWGRLRGYVQNNAVAFLALFVALGGTGAYAANTIRSSDIVDGQVFPRDLAPASRLGGMGRSTGGGTSPGNGKCNPVVAQGYEGCVQVELDLPAPARVFLTGSVTASADQGKAIGWGACRFRVVQPGLSAFSLPDSAADVFVGPATTDAKPLTTSAVTKTVSSGRQVFTLECAELYPYTSNQGINFSSAKISAVALSAR
jgi:hypothetical protein